MKKQYIIGILVVAILIIILIDFFLYQKYYYPYSGNAPEITNKELECGCYYGNDNQKKPGTPDNWVWKTAGISSLWHNPELSIQELNGCYSCLFGE